MLLGQAVERAQTEDEITCVDAESGEILIDRQRAKLRQIYASPIGAANRVYFVGRDGTTLVFTTGPEFRQLARNELGEYVDASPVAVGDQLFIRGKENLYCIAEEN